MSYPDKIGLGLAVARSWADLKQIPRLQDNGLNEIERVLIHHFTETLGRRPKMARHIQGG